MGGAAGVARLVAVIRPGLSELGELWSRRRGRVIVPHTLAASLCGGLAAAVWLRAPGFEVAVVAVGCAAASVLVSRSRLVWMAAALALAGLWWGSVRLDAVDRSPLLDLVGQVVRVRAEVTSPVRAGQRLSRAFVRVLAVSGSDVRDAAQLEFPSDRAPPRRGSLLEALVEVRLPDAPREAADGRVFDERAYLERRGVQVVLSAHTVEVVGRRGGLSGLSDRLRESIRTSLALGVDDEQRALVRGIVLGEEEGLDDELRNQFRASGLFHLLAVSGQNVAYVVAGVLLLAWVLGVPRALAMVGALACVGGYVAAVGWQPSVVRAAVAGMLAVLAWLVARPRDRWYFMLVGCAFLLAVSPYNLLDPGFQLSFAAVASIFVLVPRLERILAGYPVPARLGSIVAVASAAGAATAPLLWVHFGSVPLFSIGANALAEPVVAPILGLGLVAAALAPVLPSAAAAAGWLNGWLLDYLAWCARIVGSAPHAEVRSGWTLITLVIATGVIIGWRRLPRHHRPSALVGLLALVAATGGWWALRPATPPLPTPAGLRVAFLDVGQGDATLLQTKDAAILVDQGPPEAEVARLLPRYGLTRLDLLVLTHPQRDHVGGAVDVINRFEVSAVMLPGLPVPHAERDAALALVSRKQVPVVHARRGAVYRVGSLRVEVLWPDGPGSPAEDPNGRAIVLLATYGDADVLLPADAESQVTNMLGLRRVEVLKVAHHGSRDDGLAALLERTRPQLAVVSVGADNPFGHPTPSTVAALEGAPGLVTFRTDRDGTVIVETDGTRLTVTTDR